MAPPNTPLVMAGWTGSAGVVPMSGRHQGGCHILMDDGAVQFVTDTIEAGNQTIVGCGGDSENSVTMPDPNPPPQWVPPDNADTPAAN